MMFKFLISIGLWLSILFASYVQPVYSWGGSGHQIICQIAYDQLTDSAQFAIDDLIQIDTDYSSFAESCVYADTQRPYRSSDHYVDLSRDASGFGNVPCPQSSKCVVSAVMQDLAALVISTDEKQKLMALKYLGHWVGDLHQPLHVSFGDDRGGEDINVTGICRTKDLHGVWDRCLIEEKLNLDVQTQANLLINQFTPVQLAEWADADITIDAVIAWADESFQIALEPDIKYCIQGNRSCWYANNNERLEREENKRTVPIDYLYIEKHVGTVSEQLTKAGVRLASILNQVFDE